VNYRAIYDRLMERARAPRRLDYFEAHHVLPRCLGGSDDRENIVHLTAREHHVAHQLLVAMNPGHPGLALAAHMMCLDRYGHRVGNRRYEWLRRRHAQATATLHAGKKWALGIKRRDSTKAKLSAAALGNTRGAGHTRSDDGKRRISEAQRGKPKSPEHVEKLRRAKIEASLRKPPYSDGTPRILGVSETKAGFVAHAVMAGKRQYVGVFKAPGLAAAAIEQATRGS